MSLFPIFHFFHFLSVTTFSHGRSAWIKKTYFVKVDGRTQKPRRRHLSRPCRPFWGPLTAILDFAGVEQVPPLQDWYLNSTSYFLGEKNSENKNQLAPKKNQIKRLTIGSIIITYPYLQYQNC